MCLEVYADLLLGITRILRLVSQAKGRWLVTTSFRLGVCARIDRKEFPHEQIKPSQLVSLGVNLLLNTPVEKGQIYKYKD